VGLGKTGAGVDVGSSVRPAFSEYFFNARLGVLARDSRLEGFFFFFRKAFVVGF